MLMCFFKGVRYAKSLCVLSTCDNFHPINEAVNLTKLGPFARARLPPPPVAQSTPKKRVDSTAKSNLAPSYFHSQGCICTGIIFLPVMSVE